METPSDITVQMGETAHMFCEMRGSPPPPRRWLRNEQEIQATTRVFVRGQRELIIMQAQPSDQGSYVCQAQGPDGNVITKTFNVVVLGKNEGFFVLKKFVTIFVEAEKITGKWTIIGDRKEAQGWIRILMGV